MPIDSSIALGVRAPADPLNQLARVLQVQGLQKQAETADFEMGERRRAADRQNKLYGLLADTAPDQLEPTLTRGGFLKEAGEVGKQRRENVKLDAEAKAKEIEAASKRLDLAGQAFGSVRANPTPETANAALDFLEQNKIYTPQQTAQYRAQIAANPQSIAGLADQAFRAALSAKDQLPKYDTRNLGGTTETTAIDPVTGKLAVVNVAQNTQTPDNAASNARMAAEGAANRALTARGQNMTDDRAREAYAATLSKPFEITGEDGKPVLVQQDKQGNIRPVQGYAPKQGASKPLTEGQSKALLFGARMQDSGAIIDELAEKGVNKSIPGSRSGYGVGATINAMQPKELQRLDQAKRDFVNAVLRRESGAVISAEEFANAEQQYFPQPGEGKEVIEQKRRAREVATRGILAEVPDAENRVAKVRGDRAAKPAPTSDGWGIEKVK